MDASVSDNTSREAAPRACQEPDATIRRPKRDDPPVGVTSTFGRLANVPVDLLGALGVLPSIADNTATMAESTAVLPQVLRSISDVARDASALPALRDEMRGMGEALQVLEAMDARMASIEAAMPVLVEVQQHLARVPDTLERLDGNITVLAGAVERLLEVLGALDTHVSKLQGSIGPLSRMAQRLPGGRQRG